MIFKHNDKQQKKQSRISETDKFWDIESITPVKKAVKKQNVFSSTDSVHVSEKETEVSNVRAEAIPRAKSERYESELCLSYAPENSLVKSVEVYN